MSDDEPNTMDDEFFAEFGQQVSASPPAAKAAPVEDDNGDSVDDFMASNDLAVQRTVPDITKPWMKHHKFELVRSIQQLNEIIDAAIVAKKCALDLETQGLDNRIFYDAAGKPYTNHKVVGYCLSYDGIKGYYVPIRHCPEDGGTALNLPEAETEAAIRRLCLASQPQASPAVVAKDPLSFKGFETPPQVVIYFWNAKFDHEFLYPVTGIDWWHPESFEDGNLVYFVYYSADRNLSLKDKAVQELKDIEGNPHEMIKLKELFVHGRRDIHFQLLAPDEPGCVKYACSDAINTFLLCTAPRKHESTRSNVLQIVLSQHLFTYRVEKQVAQAGRWMERPRVRVNREKIEKIRVQNVLDRDAVLKKIMAVATAKNFHGFDVGSPKQLGEFLFGSQGLDITLSINSVDFPNGKPQINEKSKQYKTDADTLERLLEEHPSPPDILKWVVEWRKYEKMDTTYLQSLVTNIDGNSEMRFQFKQTGAATGRFSAPAGQADQGYSGIPIHGIPGTSALRQAFEAREGYTFAKCDYAGQELRIAANVSNEMVWIKEFLEGTGDLHSITARAFFNKTEVSKDERKMGKIANFALVYGGGPAAIMRATGCDKLEATRRKQAFDKSVPTFAKWIKGQHVLVKKHKGIWTAFGRWIGIPDIDSPDRMIMSACERHSTNYPIQGSGADIMKISMVVLCKEFYKLGWLRQGGGDDSVRMLLTVHDEIVFEIKHARVQEALGVIVKVMASPTQMARPPHSPLWKVPLVVEPLVGTTWAGEYNYDMMLHGMPYKQGDKSYKGKDKKYKDQKFQWGGEDWQHLTGCEPSACDCGVTEDIELVVGDRIYHKVPDWLTGLFIPSYLKTETAVPPIEDGETPLEAPLPEATQVQVAPAVVPTPAVVAPAPPMVPVPPPPMAVAAQAPAPLEVQTSDSDKFMVKLTLFTKQSIEQVRVACVAAYDPDAKKIVCIQDGFGFDLVGPSLNIRVSPEKFIKALLAVNLIDGRIYPYVPPGLPS